MQSHVALLEEYNYFTGGKQGNMVRASIEGLEEVFREVAGMNRCRCCGKHIGYDRKVCFSCLLQMIREWFREFVVW